MRWLFLAFLLSSPALAGDWSSPLAVRDSGCACSNTPHDSFEEPLRFAFGKFRGECVDSCRFRRARVLEEDGDSLTVGNILESGHFYEGVIPLGKVTGVEVGFERFAPLISHVFLRFTLSEPIALSDQSGKVRVTSTKTLVLSAEGVPAKGHKYRLYDGYGKQYLMAARLVTGEELERWTKLLKHPVTIYPLTLKNDQAARVLREGILESDAKSFQYKYQLFTNNCSTSALGLLDHETGYHLSSDPLGLAAIEQALPIAGPLGTLRALRERGLVKGDETGFSLSPTAAAHPY